MRKINILMLFLWMFFWIVIVCVYSCGVRKSNVEKSKEETTSTVTDNSTSQLSTDTNIKTTTTVRVDDKNQTVTEETEYTPSDNTKESFVIEKDGTKVILNNAKKIVRKTSRNNNTQTELIGKTEQLKKEVVKEQKAVTNTNTLKKEYKSKQTDKKSVPWYYVVSGFGIVFIFFYWFGKRNGFI